MMTEEKEEIEYTVYLPKYFDNYEWAIEGKGRIADLHVVFRGKIFRINMYDVETLAATCRGDLESEDCFTEPNIVVVRDANKENIFAALKKVARDGFSGFVSEPEIPDMGRYVEYRCVV